MITLGIDPGSHRIGYGVVKRSGGGVVSLVDSGLIEPKGEGNGLSELKSNIDGLIKLYRPRACGLERLFFSKNKTTAIRTAEARGVILLALSQNNVPVIEFTPNEVKSAITGNGGADKAAVSKMVCLMLGLTEAPKFDDITDALALAIISTNKRLDS